MGKEIERPITSPEAIAQMEVEGYIERTERAAETSIQDNQGSQASQASQVKADVANQQPVPTVVGNTTPKNIVLPLNEKGISDGLKFDISWGVRWLSEWCVMMIKKYPGRVFYSPAERKYD